jgi:hypothetical protein
LKAGVIPSNLLKKNDKCTMEFKVMPFVYRSFFFTFMFQSIRMHFLFVSSGKRKPCGQSMPVCVFFRLLMAFHTIGGKRRILTDSSVRISGTGKKAFSRKVD